MKINTLLTISIALFSFCCHDKVVKQHETAGVKMGNKNDTIPEMNLLDSEYELKNRLTDSVLEIMFSRITPKDEKDLNKPFYKSMKGTFNGEPAILNLNYGHLWENGEWAFEGNLFLEKQQKAYDIKGYQSEKLKYIYFGLIDASISFHEELFMMFGHFDNQNQGLKGTTLNFKNLKQDVFEFTENHTVGVVLDLNECYIRKKYLYKGVKKVWEDGREYWVANVNTMPMPLKENKQATYNFLINKLKLNDSCAIICNSFAEKGIRTIKETIETEGQLRNSSYSVLSKNNVYWNDDGLLVIRHHSVENTALTTWGDEELGFETYDLKKKRLLTDSDVFKEAEKKSRKEQFDKSIYDYFCWDYYYTNDKIALRLHETNGFTSKGFYMVGIGNHGWYVSPVFIPYKAVEPFLRDDFKTQYWKK
jgi:hypothetical protein